MIYHTHAHSHWQHWKGRRYQLFFKIGLSLFVFSLFSGIIYFSPIFRLTTVKVHGEANIPHQKIQSFVKENFHYGESQSLCLPFSPLTKKIMAHFPQIEKLKIHRQLPHTMLIEITPRRPYLLGQFKNNFFLVDPNDVVFQRGSKSQLYPLLTIEASAFSGPQIGKTFLSQSLWEKIKPAIDYFWAEKKSFHFSQAVLVSPEQLNIRLQPGPMIYLKTSDLDRSFIELEALRKQEGFFHLQYVDLRYKNRAYLK